MKSSTNFQKWRQLPEETRQTYKEGAKAQREAWQERVSKLKEDPKAREALEVIIFLWSENCFQICIKNKP